MDSVVRLSMVVIAILESLIGIILNTAIVAANIAVVKNKQKRNPSHLLTVAMGMVNVLLICVAIIEVIIYMLWQPVFLVRKVIIFFSVAISWLLSFSYWLTTWLCVYYFVTVTNFKQQISVNLKRTFSSLLPYLLVVSGVGTFVISLMSIWDANFLEQTNDTVTLHAAKFLFPYSFSKLYRISSSMFGCWLPFTLAFISMGLTLYSILGHIWRLKQNSFDFSASQLQAHVNAVRTMFLLFLLCVASYLMEIFGISNIFFSDYMFLLIWMFLLSFPTIEAAILIQASSKLRKMFRIKCLMVDRNHDECQG